MIENVGAWRAHLGARRAPLILIVGACAACAQLGAYVQLYSPVTLQNKLFYIAAIKLLSVYCKYQF